LPWGCPASSVGLPGESKWRVRGIDARREDACQLVCNYRRFAVLHVDAPDGVQLVRHAQVARLLALQYAPVALPALLRLFVPDCTVELGQTLWDVRMLGQEGLAGLLGLSEFRRLLGD
jgi:hypothetical protein